MMSLFKSLFHKIFFWFLMGGVTLVIIGGIFLFFRSKEPQFRLKPMPKEDLEVRTENGKQIVDAKKDGYQLTLDPKLRVFTREIESGRVMIYKGDSCKVEVNKLEGSEEKTVLEWFHQDKEDIAWENSIGVGLTVIDYHLEKISDMPLEAYYNSLETEEFGIEKSIWIKGKNGIYSISESNGDHKCLPIEDILRTFQFKP